jgi:tripartite-type tricarboxylate transporter receptor subunit TctC
VKAGKLRVLAVAASKRLGMLPDVPTIAEAGVNFSADNFFAVMVPRGTPPQAIATLNRAVRQAVESTDLKQRLLDQGVELRYTAGEEFAKVIDEEFRTWGKVVQQAKVRLQ